MSGNRNLLRLEDKVAASGRHLELIGGPPLGHLVPILALAALVIHGAVLLLPAVRSGRTLPASSPPQDFPLVWRMTPAAPTPAPAVPGAVSLSRTDPSRPTLASEPARGTVRRSAAVEPVLEPTPQWASMAVVADVEPLIPAPDAPPPAVEPASPAGPPMLPPDAPPALIHRVAPVYPVAARSLRAEARVTLRLAVAADGSVADASVEGCTRPGLGFEDAALDAVRRWRYERAPYQAANRTVLVTVDFKRQEGRP